MLSRSAPQLDKMFGADLHRAAGSSIQSPAWTADVTIARARFSGSEQKYLLSLFPDLPRPCSSAGKRSRGSAKSVGRSLLALHLGFVFFLSSVSILVPQTHDRV